MIYFQTLSLDVIPAPSFLPKRFPKNGRTVPKNLKGVPWVSEHFSLFKDIKEAQGRPGSHYRKSFIRKKNCQI